MRVPIPVLLCAMLLAGCGLPPGIDAAIPPAARTLPAPDLAPTAAFDAPLAAAAPDAQRLTDANAALAARAAALRARASALDAPVIDAETRARLARAVEDAE